MDNLDTAYDAGPGELAGLPRASHPGTADIPMTTAGRALAALRGELAGRGVRAEAMMLARWHGQLWSVGGPVVGYAAGLFWWPAARLGRDGRPVYAVHDARDPAGAARRVDGAARMPPGRSRRVSWAMRGGAGREQ